MAHVVTRRLAFVFLLIAGMVALAGPVIAAWDPEKTPVTPVPASRWGNLEPGPVLGDTTFFNLQDNEPGNVDFYHDLDIQGQFLFTATGNGVAVFNIANPNAPDELGRAYGPVTAPRWTFSDQNFFVFSIDLIDGNDDIAAVGAAEQGMMLWNFQNKAAPVVHYQDFGTSSDQVYTTRIANTNYAFSTSRNSGPKVYDMNVAAGFNGCNENSALGVVCAGVFKGVIGSYTGVQYITGVDDFIAVRYNAFPSRRIDIWDVSNPAAPLLANLKLSGVPGIATATGVQMWRDGSQYYLAVAGASQLAIYNVSCITGSGSCNLPAPTALVNVPTAPGAFQQYLSLSESGGKTYLYVADGSEGGTSCIDQREYLLDVTNPSSPTDITPMQAAGPYWGWYYEQCPDGSNNTRPHAGKFRGTTFYRAAFSFLDSHSLAGTQPPVADFSFTPPDPEVGQAVLFTDQSTGNPDSWSWTFQDATPSSSSLRNPTATFNSAGTKTVTLVATNSAGPSPTRIKTVTVSVPPDPTPGIVSVSRNVTAALECTPVTFTAQGLTGQQPLDLAWEIRDSTGQPVDTGGDVNPFEWDTTGATPGVYTATATVDNALNMPASATSGGVTVSALPNLQFTGPGQAPTNLPFSGATVQFNIQAQGATEWNWDFGDGQGFVGWDDDPIDGPSPTYTYANPGTYDVRVQIRNCVQSALLSNTLSVEIVFEPLALTDFRATSCPFGQCQLFTTGDSVDFTTSDAGNPDAYEYDWDGDGSYEEIVNAPITSRIFCDGGLVRPSLQIRRGNDPAVVRDLLQTLGFNGPTPSGCAPPSAPGGLTADVVGDNIVVDWLDVLGETEFRVLRSSNGVNDKLLARTNPGVTIFTDTTAIPGVTYTYVVRAFKPNGGVSPESNTDTAMVPDLPPPAEVFGDNFESGDLRQWSSFVVPEGRESGQR
ncbi:MAG: PKD domain-containing protein [Acidobacteriota bacterium]